MSEPTYEHLRAVESVIMQTRGFRQEFDAITFIDGSDDEDEEWTPTQRELLTRLAKAVLEVDDA